MALWSPEANAGPPACLWPLGALHRDSHSGGLRGRSCLQSRWRRVTGRRTALRCSGSVHLKTFLGLRNTAPPLPRPPRGNLTGPWVTESGAGPWEVTGPGGRVPQWNQSLDMTGAHRAPSPSRHARPRKGTLSANPETCPQQTPGTSPRTAGSKSCLRATSCPGLQEIKTGHDAVSRRKPSASGRLGCRAFETEGLPASAWRGQGTVNSETWRCLSQRRPREPAQREQGARRRGRKTRPSAAGASAASASARRRATQLPPRTAHSITLGATAWPAGPVRPGEVPARRVNQGALIGKQQ